jgi:hypothetical protein
VGRKNVVSAIPVLSCDLQQVLRYHVTSPREGREDVTEDGMVDFLS